MQRDVTIDGGACSTRNTNAFISENGFAANLFALVEELFESLKIFKQVCCLHKRIYLAFDKALSISP